jgi:hypothetical protein
MEQTTEEEGLVEVLVDANSGDNPHPYLVFNSLDGTLVIADDYETSNDLTARDFTLTKDDALTLAIALLRYARDGTPNSRPSVSAADVTDFIDRNRRTAH